LKSTKLDASKLREFQAAYAAARLFVGNVPDRKMSQLMEPFGNWQAPDDNRVVTQWLLERIAREANVTVPWKNCPYTKSVIMEAAETLAGWSWGDVYRCLLENGA